MNRPKCGALHVAKILYGLIDVDEELEQKLEEGSLILGGCCIGVESRDWHCNSCGHEWGDDLSKKLARMDQKRRKREALEDNEAQKRGVLTAYLRPDGWTNCPYCKINFAMREWLLQNLY